MVLEFFENLICLTATLSLQDGGQLLRAEESAKIAVVKPYKHVAKNRSWNLHRILHNYLLARPRFIKVLERFRKRWSWDQWPGTVIAGMPRLLASLAFKQGLLLRVVPTLLKGRSLYRSRDYSFYRSWTAPNRENCLVGWLSRNTTWRWDLLPMHAENL